MKPEYQLFWAACLTLLLTAGCNTISYYHSERVSVACIETKTSDPAAPVQGTIGVRSRTVLVAPGKNDHSLPGIKPQTTAVAASIQQSASQVQGKENESASVISDFYLKRDGTFLGRTTIESAFITGSAAKNAPAGTIEAITGLGTGGADEISQKRREFLDQIYDYLDSLSSKDSLAGEKKARLDKLGEKLPSDLSSRRYYIQDAANAENLKDRSPYAAVDNFKGVLDYAKLLNSQTEYLDHAILKNGPYKTYNGAAIDAKTLAQFETDGDRIAQEKKTLFDTIGNDPAINDAVEYVNKTL